MRHYIYQKFLSDSIEMLKPEYQELFEPLKDSFFLYSNLFELPLYYRPFTWTKDHDYKIYEKVHKTKFLDIVEYYLDEVGKEDYNPNLNLLLVSYICNIYVNKYINEYIGIKYDTFRPKQKMFLRSDYKNGMEATLYKEKTGKSIKTFKLDKTTILDFDEVSSNFLQFICSRFYHFTIGKKVFDVSLKKFKRYYWWSNFEHLGLFKCYLWLKDITSRSKILSMCSISKVASYNKKMDYTNDGLLFEKYDEALNECHETLYYVFEYIYFKNKKVKPNIMNNIKKLEEN